MQLKQVQINLNAPIGQLGEVRKSHVLQALGVPFTIQPAPVPGFVAYVDPMHRRSVMLAEHQIIFIHEGDNISPDLRDAERILAIAGRSVCGGYPVDWASRGGWGGDRDVGGAVSAPKRAGGSCAVRAEFAGYWLTVYV